jgi:1-deoxy-D-xylulose-5-phosphate synthase
VSAILDKVNSPEDLKKLSYPELDQLAQEIREEIVKTISTNGGHLASSLGAVELTIALHRILNSPNDKIIWDVGHQTYAHKLLTGRKERFTTIRQYGGLSGFPSRQESPHDAFTTGHAGTSISAALGMAVARDINKDKYQVVAVIGDGSLGNGMSFEAVNHTGHLGTKLTVVLNDNGMSISPTLGALSRLLNQVRLDNRYELAKRKAKRLFRRLPFGGRAWSFGIRAKKGFERVILPNAFWEQMGFIYLGPFDGHDIRAIEAALVRARDHETRPVVIHLLTIKGKGHAAAEDNATKFHGVSPKITVRENGNSSYSQVFGNTLKQLMKDNDKIIAISAAMIEGTGLAPVAAAYPERVIDVGICEQHAVTLAAGLATQGFVPVVAIYSTFLQRAYDQILSDVCLQNLPVVFAIDRAGIVGEDGATHQGVFDLSYMSSMPNMAVSAPKDEDEMQHLIYTAVKSGRPIAIRYPRGYGEGVVLNPDFKLLPIGHWEMLKDGGDLAIVAVGSTVYPALSAAKLLSEEHIDCACINARFIKPIDTEMLLGMAVKTRRIITIEENAVSGGFGSLVLGSLSHSRLNQVKVECIGLPDQFVEHGQQEFFQAKFNLDTPGIIARIKSAFPDVQLKNQPRQLEEIAD